MRHILYGNLYVEVYICAVLAIFSFMIGFWGLYSKKPFLISLKWTLGVLVICLLPQIFNSFYYSKLIGNNLEVSPICGLMFVSIIIYALFISKNAYVVYGITDKILGEAIKNVLDEIRSDAVEIKTTVQDWMGVAQIRINDKNNGRSNILIVKGLNSYFQKANVKIKNTIFIFFIFLGGFLVSVPVYCLFFFNHFPKIN